MTASPCGPLRLLLHRTWTLLVICCILLVFLLLVVMGDEALTISHRHPTVNPDRTLALVVAKSRREDTSWAYRVMPHWRPYIYTSDQEPGFANLPANKGRESMAYLTHIVDNYDHLADITVFMHGGDSQWHNDVRDLDSPSLLRSLNLRTVERLGYANLRCHHRPGCPVAVRPFDPDMASDHNIVYRNFTSIYLDLFRVPVDQIPPEIGGVCCGQFAVSRERIRGRPKEDYMRMRDWAITTELDNFAVGSVFEMLWHIVFLEAPVACPDTQQCYCELYDLCNEEPDNS
ncbi:DUF3431 domain-containing protein [Aspergillus aculeatinus CBS 121060]|uniref:Uncharacterized protein n=1 Tax=Aspergillus aculeatinus CBS 121060 TaxID=1448322 RepID=A0ACD1GUR2_9EURO|nr:hypothetical protein BO66DRAFT_226789 [Aspergillus aculeatinus CBS 121060]RAH64952.1 hypothetical protein BO66DRAFT_226789 [Aspergillus aculeatinus CBS 121060]